LRHGWIGALATSTISACIAAAFEPETSAVHVLGAFSFACIVAIDTVVFAPAQSMITAAQMPALTTRVCRH
jgi:hypothetical protein